MKIIPKTLRTHYILISTFLFLFLLLSRIFNFHVLTFSQVHLLHTAQIYLDNTTIYWWR